jgi:hypothetical protein
MIRLLLILLVAVVCQARLNFEISLGQSSDWTIAGWTELTPDGQVLDVSDDAKDAQHTTATSDGLVYVRLANHPNIQTSIPAPCWSGEVTLHLEDEATPVALSFPSCSKAKLTQQQLQQATTITIPTSISKVYTTHPASANTITMKQVKEIFDALSSASNSGNKKASPFAQDDYEEEGEGEEEGGGEGKRRRKQSPPPDDKTWLQKNWMLVLPLGLIVLNRMVAPPPPEAQQQGGEGAAAAPRRK